MITWVPASLRLREARRICPDGMADPNAAAAPPPLDPVVQQQIIAILGAQDLAPFEQLIQGLMSPQNNVRSQAEVIFEACKAPED